MINYYIKDKKATSLNHISSLKNFLNDIVEKYPENVDNNDKERIKEISFAYIKEALEEHLTCPLSKKIFTNPYIGPDGKTCELGALLESYKNDLNNKEGNKILDSKQVIKDLKVLRLLELYNKYKDNFGKDACCELKEILTSENKNYINQIVNEKANENVEEININEGNNINKNHENKIIKSLMEKIGKILDLLQEDFFKEVEVPKNKMSRTNLNNQIINEENGGQILENSENTRI